MSGANLLNPSRLTPYAANGVNFDGANDYLTRGAGLTGAADGKEFTVSFWFKTTQAVGAVILDTPNGRVSITSDVAAGVMTFDFDFLKSNDDGVAELSSTVDVNDGLWHHIICSFNAATDEKYIFVDDASSISVGTFIDGIVDFTDTNCGIFATSSGTSKFDACIADFWMTLSFFDISVQANRRKFIDASGNPVDLGSDGSTPTGTAPLIFFSGATASWHTNKGSGGGFTENGALSDCASDP